MQCLIAVVAFVLMLTINVPLAIVAMIMMPVIGVLGVIMRKRTFPVSWLIQARLAQVAMAVDESYDAATADAVSRFQAARHLTVDGAVGPHETAPALGVTL